MSGTKSGVQKRINTILKRNVPYIHCYIHKLHLIVVDVCKNFDSIKIFVDTSRALQSFFSRLVVSQFYKQIENTHPIPKLLETRWIGHYNITKAILENYKEIQETLDYFTHCKDIDIKLKAIGLKSLTTNEQFVLAG